MNCARCGMKISRRPVTDGDGLEGLAVIGSVAWLDETGCYADSCASSILTAAGGWIEIPPGFHTNKQLNEVTQ